MSELTVGRVGLDVEIGSPARWTQRAAGPQGVNRTETISGELRASSLANTKALRSELLAQVGQLVPILSDDDSTLNGIYLLDSADVDLDAYDGPLNDVGVAMFTVTATRVGSFSEVEFQSLLGMVDAAEDFSTTASYWHSPPVGTKAYSAGAASPTLIERATEDGDILTAYDIPEGTHPTWSVDPADYYDGAVELWAGSRLRAGRDMPMDPADWEINAKTMKVRPGAVTGSSNGEIEVAAWDGAWNTWVPFKITWAGTNDVPSWDYVSVLRNTPEVVAVRLVRDAAESPFATTAKHELDITVRRGCRLVSCVYKFDGSAQTHAVARASSAAATRPGGTASYITFNTLVDGDRWMLGCPRAFTANGTTGEIELDTASKSMPFWIGVAVNNASSGGNGPADLAGQYVGQSGEQVRAVRR